MFNGIIYQKGIIKKIRKSPRYVNGSLVVEIDSNIKLKKNDIGESVCCDGVCLTLIRINNKTFSFYLSKELENKKLIKFLIEKASISINGISLTISKVGNKNFEINVIPHTLKLTNLGKLKTKDIVNVELDIFSKYILKLSN